MSDNRRTKIQLKPGHFLVKRIKLLTGCFQQLKTVPRSAPLQSFIFTFECISIVRTVILLRVTAQGRYLTQRSRAYLQQHYINKRRFCLDHDPAETHRDQKPTTVFNSLKIVQMLP